MKAARKAIPGLVLAGILAAPGGALGTVDTVRLAGWCGSGTAVASGACLAYLEAVADALVAGRVIGISACLPPTTTLSRLHSIFLDRYSPAGLEHPQNAFEFVAKVFAGTYPCSK